MYAAKIIADSIAFGVRLTTFEVTFPRFILAEYNTHKMISKNSASSRAIPVERRIEQVTETPFVPEAFSKNKPGMQADGVLDRLEAEHAREAWLDARDGAVRGAEALADIGVHKQHANRLLEPFAWHTVVATATEWENFFNLRCHPAAQPEMQITANLMREAYKASVPRVIVGAWHLPYVTQEDFMGRATCDLDDDEYFGILPKISVARCAAVSYERQNVEKPIEQYVARHDSLLELGHLSPFEHQAQVVGEWNRPPFSEHWTATKGGEWRSQGFFCGNLRAPWLQYRKTIPNEDVFRGAT